MAQASQYTLVHDHPAFLLGIMRNGVLLEQQFLQVKLRLDPAAK